MELLSSAGQGKAAAESRIAPLGTAKARQR